MTEKELVAIIGSAMHANGTTAGTKPLFVNCVSGRKRYPLVDSPASDNVIAEGDIVFVDGGGASDGYVSDILRLIGVGKLRPEDRRYAEVAAGATQAAIDSLRPGVRVSEIIRTASRHVATEGIQDPVGSIAGHGIGLELWERPLITEHEDPDDDVAVRENMVLCIEPILAPPHPDGGLAGIFVFEQQVLRHRDRLRGAVRSAPSHVVGDSVTRILYVSPMPYGANAAVTAISHGIEATVAAAGAELRVAVRRLRQRELARRGRPRGPARAPTPASIRS